MDEDGMGRKNVISSQCKVLNNFHIQSLQDSLYDFIFLSGRMEFQCKPLRFSEKVPLVNLQGLTSNSLLPA